MLLPVIMIMRKMRRTTRLAWRFRWAWTRGAATQIRSMDTNTRKSQVRINYSCKEEKGGLTTTTTTMSRTSSRRTRMTTTMTTTMNRAVEEEAAAAAAATTTTTTTTLKTRMREQDVGELPTRRRRQPRLSKSWKRRETRETCTRHRHSLLEGCGVSRKGPRRRHQRKNSRRRSESCGACQTYRNNWRVTRRQPQKKSAN
mmetsp:Transcript_7880/g.20707  ORF Transcript_7880/g.20707 Transcript_7880/m.20707 type:complete len:200 (-) Transcript_7880:90-689(-)